SFPTLRSSDLFTNGSGDTSYDWITLLILFLGAFIGTIIWSIADRKRKSYVTCYHWLTTFIRYYIAFMLINYGMIKLVHGQMPPPGLDRLMQPLGEFSPIDRKSTRLNSSHVKISYAV